MPEWALQNASLLIVAAALVVSLSACQNQASTPRPADKGQSDKPTDPKSSARPSSTEQIATLSRLSEALQFARPSMGTNPVPDMHSLGTQLFAYWAEINRQTIFDWTGTANETSFALIRKDVDEALGKHICSSGTVVEIHKTLLEDQKVYWGLLITYSENLVSFWAVGSTGTLVEEHGAKFCGFVTGLYDYHNSSGGTGHAAEVVGYFQLPENKRSVTIAAPVPASSLKDGERPQIDTVASRSTPIKPSPSAPPAPPVLPEKRTPIPRAEASKRLTPGKSHSPRADTGAEPQKEPPAAPPRPFVDPFAE